MTLPIVRIISPGSPLDGALAHLYPRSDLPGGLFALELLESRTVTYPRGNNVYCDRNGFSIVRDGDTWPSHYKK